MPFLKKTISTQIGLQALLSLPPLVQRSRQILIDKNFWLQNFNFFITRHIKQMLITADNQFAAAGQCTCKKLVIIRVRTERFR